MKDIAIYGAGGLGREIALLIRQINDVKPTWNLLGFYDEKPFSGFRNGLPYLGALSELNAISYELNLIIAIGNCQVKKQVFERIANSFIRFPVLLHPTVILQPYQNIEIGQGSVIGQNCVLTTDLKIGKHVWVSPACNLTHDSEIADFSSLMYAVNISGNVKLETATFLGTNATVLQGLSIGENSIIGAGAVVTKSIPANCTAVGVPAKILQK
jgi:sugar O-acyltransferase (sialic acid O-acetyltransferase NeuD family)